MRTVKKKGAKRGEEGLRAGGKCVPGSLPRASPSGRRDGGPGPPGSSFPSPCFRAGVPARAGLVRRGGPQRSRAGRGRIALRPHANSATRTVAKNPNPTIVLSASASVSDGVAHVGSQVFAATFQPRARFLLVSLSALFVVACLVTIAVHPKHAATIKGLVSAYNEPKLWSSPTAEDYQVLRAIPVERPPQYKKMRLVFAFGWYNGLTNMDFAAVSSFIVAKSIGAEVCEGSRGWGRS